MFVRDGSSYRTYIGNGFASGGPEPSRFSIYMAWQPYPGLR